MIKTRAAQVLVAKAKQAEGEFKVIKAEGPKRLPKTKPPQPTQKKSQVLSAEDEEFEAIFGDGPRRRQNDPKKDKNAVTFDKARREVLNFGIAGSSSATEKSDQITQMLIKLGAKPPKRRGRNYKEILEEKKKQKEADEQVNKRTLFGTSASLQYRSQKRKAPKNDGLLKSYGKLDKDSLRQINKNKSASMKKRKQ